MMLTRIELVQVCKKHKPKHVFITSKLARRWGCEVLFLPVGHSKLNSIEMVWSRMKAYVKQCIIMFSLNEVDCLAYGNFDKFDEAE